jgi:hypothetical protein
VKKWTTKVDLFSKKYVVIPVNEAYIPLFEETDGSAHWYVAIICNLDQVKPKKEAKPPRTRNRSKSGRASPELVDGDEEIPEASTMTLPAETDDVIPMTPIESRPDTPTLAIEAQDPVPPVISPVIPPMVATSQEIPEGQFTRVIDLDLDMDIPAQENMNKEFREMSISNNPDSSYDFRNDDSIDLQQKEAIAAAMGTEKRYTRRTSTIRADDAIMLDVDEPDALTSAMRQKDGTSKPSTSTTTRRISGKPMPPNTYFPHNQFLF